MSYSLFSLDLFYKPDILQSNVLNKQKKKAALAGDGFGREKLQDDSNILAFNQQTYLGEVLERFRGQQRRKNRVRVYDVMINTPINDRKRVLIL
jgi:hypothetical protein